MQDWPSAYLITFRTHASWLPGDDRGSVDRWHSLVGGPTAPPAKARAAYHAGRLTQPPVTLTPGQRNFLTSAIEETCAFRNWSLLAANVRSNHVHVLVTAAATPERVMRSLKARATRTARESGVLGPEQKLWARHGSTRHLWKPADIEAAWDYVVHGQD